MCQLRSAKFRSLLSLMKGALMMIRHTHSLGLKWNATDATTSRHSHLKDELRHFLAHYYTFREWVASSVWLKKGFERIFEKYFLVKRQKKRNVQWQNPCNANTETIKYWYQLMSYSIKKKEKAPVFSFSAWSKTSFCDVFNVCLSSCFSSQS
jgi:hypothetical protein